MNKILFVIRRTISVDVISYTYINLTSIQDVENMEID